jgi:biotin carboxyl carrier protein
MKTKIKIGDKSYQVEISELKEDLVKVRVGDADFFFSKNEFGEVVPVEDQDERLKTLTEENGVYLETLTEKEIKSPIAGTLSSIEIKRGDNLKPGQKVATLIAMKMENEIIAETLGEVKEIKVKEGQFVNAGDILIVLK